MAKITLDSVISGFKSVTRLVSNFSKIEDSLNNDVLWRDNPEGEPNQMEDDLDMNTNRITNLPSPVNDTDAVRWVDVKDGVSGVNEVVPSQSGNEKVALTTNGTSLVFGAVDSDNVDFLQAGTGGSISVSDYLDAQSFPTVSSMKLATLPIGCFVSTKGFHTVGDGGAADYLIVASQSADGYSEHTLSDGNVAVLQPSSKTHAEQFGWPISEAEATLNAAMSFASAANQAEVYYSVPCTNQTTTISIPTDMVIIGPSASVAGEIKMADGVAATVTQAETSGFISDLTAQPAEVLNGLHANCGFRNVFLNGNKDNRTGSITDWKEGIGLRAYWIRPVLDNVQIHGQTGIGFYSQFDRGAIVDFPSKVDTDSIAGFIDKLTIRNNDYEGFIFNGPSDVRIDNMYVGYSANGLHDTTYNASLRSLKYPTETVDSVVFDGFGADVGYLHIFGNPHGRGMVVKNSTAADQVRSKFEYLMCESCFGGAYFSEDARIQVAMLDLHNNTGGDGTRPHLQDDTVQGLIATNIEVYRGGVENGCNSLEIAGQQSNIASVNIYGKARAGHGVVFSGNNNMVMGANIDGVQGSNYNSEVSCGVVTRSGALNNVFKGLINSSDTVWKHEGTSRVGSFSVTGRFPNTATIVSGLENIPDEEWGATCNVTVFESGATADYLGSIRQLDTIDNTVTTEQTVTVSHNLLRTPGKAAVLTSLANQSGTIGSVDYVRVNAVTSTALDIRVKMASAGTGTSFLITNVY